MAMTKKEKQIVDELEARVRAQHELLGHKEATIEALRKAQRKSHDDENELRCLFQKEMDKKKAEVRDLEANLNNAKERYAQDIQLLENRITDHSQAQATMAMILDAAQVPQAVGINASTNSRYVLLVNRLVAYIAANGAYRHE
jgi:ATP-dependent 26S proteasome regulatory subunit